MFIEDILHLFVDSIDVEPAKEHILVSISRQIKRGKALTDRQYDLVRTKLLENQQYFEFDITQAVDNIRLPLRKIDRSKTITLEDPTEAEVANNKNFKSNWKWIKVRFPFSKKDITCIETAAAGIRNRKHYKHERGSHEHYFFFNHVNCYNLVDSLHHRNFTIDSYVLEAAQQAKQIIDNPQDFLTKPVVEEFDTDNTVMLKDRAIRYGYLCNNFVSDSSLVQDIANRDRQEFLIDPEKFTIDHIADAITKLDRFPLLILVDEENSYKQLTDIHQAFDYLVPREQQSVLFRVDNDDQRNQDVNQYIKDRSLNNWVDNNTKIVYIKKNKLPKVLLKSNFTPMAAFGKTSMRNTAIVDTYLNYHCDLIVYHDKQENLFGKYSRRYGIL